MGAAFGAAFLIRPFTGVAMALPVLAYLGVRFARRGALPLFARGLLPFAAGAAPFVLLLLLYNYAQTGDALLQPFSLYDPNDHPFHSATSLSYWWGFKHNVVERLGTLTVWQPLSVALLVIFLIRRRQAADERAGLLVVAFGGLLAAYCLYLFAPGNEYGPRYLFEALGALAIVGACSIRRLGRFARPTLTLIVLLNVVWLYSRSQVYAAEVRERMRPFELAESQHLKDAIVFIEAGAGTMLARDLTRNGIHFDGPVLFVRNLGAGNAAVLARHPERRAYAYRIDPVTAVGEIVPLDPSR